jgi:hypothetical protein
MSTWTALVWRQAATALLGGTEACDIPHNTLGLSCEGGVDRGMDWVAGMMGRNLEHRPTDLSHLDFLPTADDLQVGDGISGPKYQIRYVAGGARGTGGEDPDTGGEAAAG